PELASNLGKRLIAVLVPHHRGTRDYSHPADAREFGYQLLRHSVGEVLLGWIAGEILKGQDSQRANLRRAAIAEYPLSATSNIERQKQSAHKHNSPNSRQADPPLSRYRSCRRQFCFGNLQ